MSLPFSPIHPDAPASPRMKAFAALVLAAMAGGALAPQPVRAQAAPAATAGRGVNVPAGPLGAALAGFAQQAKVLLLSLIHI